MSFYHSGTETTAIKEEKALLFSSCYNTHLVRRGELELLYPLSQRAELSVYISPYQQSQPGRMIEYTHSFLGPWSEIGGAHIRNLRDSYGEVRSDSKEFMHIAFKCYVSLFFDEI